jgi:hypothetical protein
VIAHTGRVIVTAKATTLPVSRNASRLQLSAGTHKDDCLGRPLDWLFAHDLTKLFTAIANCLQVDCNLTEP